MKHFEVSLALVGVAALVAVLSGGLSARLRVPAPAIFLVATATVSDLAPGLPRLSLTAEQNIVTIALALVLFSGGLEIGWSSLRTVLGLVLITGLLGTALTTVLLAVGAQAIFGFGWLAAALIATALAPTDPAAVFSVLSGREVGGRTDLMLRGESGANDPVGIALMAGLVAVGSSWHATAALGALGDFCLQLVVGVAVGVAGGWLQRQLLQRLRLTSGSLYPLEVLASVLVIFGAATVAHGSGFLAVFVAGILLGDAATPYKTDIEHFHSALGSLGEIVAFTVLGLGVSWRDVATSGSWRIGLILAALLLVIRPVVMGALLIKARLSWGERAFIGWSGLKGAVPILLGTYILASTEPQRNALYDAVFVVVTFSIIVQGGSVPVVARLCGVPLRTEPLLPYTVGMRLRRRPRGLRRYRVQPGSVADGRSLRDLSRDEGLWVSLISRQGRSVPVRSDTTLRPGDDVLVAVNPEDDVHAAQQFAIPHEGTAFSGQDGG